jgi:hypothetical protein
VATMSRGPGTHGSRLSDVLIDEWRHTEAALASYCL